MATALTSHPTSKSRRKAARAARAAGAGGEGQTALAPQSESGPAAPSRSRAYHDTEPLPKERLKLYGINWAPVLWLVVIHVGLLAAPFTFTWTGLFAVLFLHWLTGGIGICLGYHRYFTHASFATVPPVRYFLAVMGCLAGEGAVVDWVASHRKHHALSDQPGDPHSPNDGAWWSHMLWLMASRPSNAQEAHVQRWAPDLQKDPFLRFLGRYYLPLHLAFAGLVFGAGWLAGGLTLACSLLVWGVFLRLAFVLHSTWAVNSASHMWGYVNYPTTDHSKNNWWVAILSYGEGWHNNHHAYPRMANHGHKWWEYDPTFRVLRLLQACGLAWNVVDYKHRSEASKAA